MAGRRRMGQRQPDVQRHEAGLGAGAEHDQGQHDAARHGRRVARADRGEIVAALGPGQHAEGEQQRQRAEAGHRQVDVARARIVGVLVMGHDQRPRRERHEFPGQQEGERVVGEHHEAHAREEGRKERQDARGRMLVPAVADPVEACRGGAGIRDGEEERGQRIEPEIRADPRHAAGLLRDMMQNHMFQLLALVAMEPPYSFASEAVRDEKAKVLHAVRPMTYEEVLTNTVRGQYGSGMADGHSLVGYREEPHVPPTSNTETYVAAKLFIENWRWAGVPFYLRSGKAMPKRLTEVAIQFRQAPHMLFHHAGAAQFQANRLVIHIQPQEGISWALEAKVPGPAVRLKTVSMDFNYNDFFGAEPSTGYETLLYDAMIGDATLFQRDDIVEAAWNIAMPILDVWQALPARDFPNYSARQSWGPETAETLIHRDGREWRKY